MNSSTTDDSVSQAERIPASTEFVPVVTVDEEERLDSVLAAPFSYVSTDGPVWRTAEIRRRIVEDERKSHVLVRRQDRVVGAVTWSAGQTPGFFRVVLTSLHDDDWTPAVVDEALRATLARLLRAAEVKRVELLVPAYGEVLLEYLTTYPGFLVEGVLRDRFFIDGEYWQGIVCRADLAAFAPHGGGLSEKREELLAALRKKMFEDLTAAHDGTSWSA